MLCLMVGFSLCEKMAAYGGNSLAVMFQKTEQSEPLPESKSQPCQRIGLTLEASCPAVGQRSLLADIQKA